MFQQKLVYHLFILFIWFNRELNKSTSQIQTYEVLVPSWGYSYIIWLNISQTGIIFLLSSAETWTHMTLTSTASRQRSHAQPLSLFPCHKKACSLTHSSSCFPCVPVMTSCRYTSRGSGSRNKATPSGGIMIKYILNREGINFTLLHWDLNHRDMSQNPM